jgi:hypothetical protein
MRGAEIGSLLMNPSRMAAGAALATLLVIGLYPLAPAHAGQQPPSTVLAQIHVRPTSGPGGTAVNVLGRGLGTGPPCPRFLDFKDSAGATTVLGYLPHTDSFRAAATIPATAMPGPGEVFVADPRYFHGCGPLIKRASTLFTVVQIRASPRGGT